jgi:hypothetical protein
MKFPGKQKFVPGIRHTVFTKNIYWSEHYEESKYEQSCEKSERKDYENQLRSEKP